MIPQELRDVNGAAWRRLEEASGVSRERWAADPWDYACEKQWQIYPVVRAAWDELQRSLRDIVTAGGAALDQSGAALDDLGREIAAGELTDGDDEGDDLTRGT